MYILSHHHYLVKVLYNRTPENGLLYYWSDNLALFALGDVWRQQSILHLIVCHPSKREFDQILQTLVPVLQLSVHP